MNENFLGDVAIVTGSGRRNGIGFGIARRLAQLGASVVVTDICRRAQPDPDFEKAAWDELVSIAEELGKFGGKHMPIKADISNPQEVESLVRQAENLLGDITILVNNAGICPVKPLMETSLSEWETTIKVNATGTFLCSLAVVKRMIARRTKGRIVNLASISGKEGWPNFGAYTASKFAVVGFTQTFAREIAQYGITVNAICPGLIATGMNDANVEFMAKFRNVTPEEVDQSQLSRVPLGRYGTPDDIGNVVAFLVSPAASYITGQSLNICGGLLVH